MGRSSFRRRSGFTLIEVLVAIGVIAVLAAMLLPALSTAREKAETATCSQNLRQIGAGLFSFAGDNQGFFPTAGSTVPRGQVDSATGKPGWTEQLDPYVGEDTTIFRCPGNARAIASNTPYSYFLGAHAAYLDAGGFAPLNLNRIRTLSRYILAGDITGDLFDPNDADKDDYTQNPFAEKPPFHRGAANILFADGSVRPVATFDPETMEISYDGPGVMY